PASGHYGSLLLGGLPVHHGGPVAVLRDFILEGIGRRGQDLHRVTAVHEVSVHHVFVSPGPGVTVHRTCGRFSFAHTVELMVGVFLLVGVIAHHGKSGARTHWHFHVGVYDHEKTAVHPFVVRSAGKLAAGAHRTWLHVSVCGPCAHEVVQFLVFGARLRH